MAAEMWVDGKWVPLDEVDLTAVGNLFAADATVTVTSCEIIYRPSRATRWLQRARHAWTVGLADTPLLLQPVVRVCYTFGWLRSPSDLG